MMNANPTAGGGVHSNYQTTTAKCGICHSVHRAKSGGVKLLNTDTATCAGCHISGTSTVTNVVIAWGTVAAPLAGPHSSASGSCTSRACHATSPHGAGGSQYGLFNAKLLNEAVDTAVAAAAADPANSGVTAALLTGAGANTDFTGAADAVRVGYTCARLTATSRPCCRLSRPVGLRIARSPTAMRSTSAPRPVTFRSPVRARSAFTAATSCAGCHDQTDATTRSGYTFPHAQRADRCRHGSADLPVVQHRRRGRRCWYPDDQQQHEVVRRCLPQVPPRRLVLVLASRTRSES